jgi:hypothetical protein
MHTASSTAWHAARASSILQRPIRQQRQNYGTDDSKYAVQEKNIAADATADPSVTHPQ